MTRFQPHSPEKTTTAEITLREAHLLNELRKMDFGEMIVYKAEGKIIRVIPKKSVLIHELEGSKMIPIK